MSRSRLLVPRWALVGGMLTILCVSVFVRVLQVSETSMVPSSYGVYVDWGAHHAIQNGRLLQSASVRPQNRYISGIEYGSQDLVAHSMHAALALFLGAEDIQRRHAMFQSLPWAGTIFVPLSLLLYFFAFRSNRSPFRQAHDSVSGVAMLAFALAVSFPLATLVGQLGEGYHGGPIAMGLMWIILYFVTLSKSKWNAPRATAVILMLVAMQLSYHTYVIYFSLLLIGVWTVWRVLHRTHGVSVPSTMRGSLIALSLVLSAAALIYVNQMFFRSYVELAKSLLSGFGGVQVNLTGLTTIQTPLVSALNIGNVIVILAVVVLFVTVALTQLRNHSAQNWAVLAAPAGFLLGVALLAPMFLLWDGLRGLYGRMSLIGTQVALVLLGYLLATGHVWLRKTSLALGICWGLLAVTSYSLSAITNSAYLGQQEFAAIQRVASELPERGEVFTDLRLGTAFAYFGEYGVHGLESQYRSRDEVQAIAHAARLNAHASDGSPYSHVVPSIADAVNSRENFAFLVSESFERRGVGFHDLSNVFPSLESGYARNVAASAPQHVYSSGRVHLVRNAADR